MNDDYPCSRMIFFGHKNNFSTEATHKYDVIDTQISSLSESARLLSSDKSDNDSRRISLSYWHIARTHIYDDTEGSRYSPCWKGRPHMSHSRDFHAIRTIDLDGRMKTMSEGRNFSADF